MSSLAFPQAKGSAGRRPRIRPEVPLAAGAVLLGLLAILLVASGQPATLAALPLVLLPTLLWRRPDLAPLVLVASALSIEQFGDTSAAPVTSAEAAISAPVAPVPITAHIPLFHGVGGLHLSPADLLLFLVLILHFIKSAENDTPRWPRSAVAACVLGLTGAVVLGIGVGMTHHGSLRVSLMEARPYVYLAVTYVLVSGLVTNRRALRAVLWAIVVTSGLKAVQGIAVFISVRHQHPRPEAVLGHEEALFFGLFIFLVAVLWLYGMRGRLRTTATWLLPVVIAANLANDRRSAWLLLGGGLITLCAVGLRSLPHRQVLLTRTALVVIMFSVVYFPAYWNHTGGTAQPARAVHSMIAPDPRDASSDLYRVQEDANLRLNIREGGLLGRGFGVPIDYTLPIADISGIDPLIGYVAHNGVLYVLMRMGVLGGIALWALIGAGIVAGCRLARCGDRELGLVGALLVCALIAYALEGAVDQGFFFYRIAFVMGSLLGLVEAARRIRQREAAMQLRPLSVLTYAARP